MEAGGSQIWLHNSRSVWRTVSGVAGEVEPFESYSQDRSGTCDGEAGVLQEMEARAE